MKQFVAMVFLTVFSLSCSPGEAPKTAPEPSAPPASTSSQAPADTARISLQIVSPHWQGIEDEFGAAFEAWYKARVGADIHVAWRDMGGTSDDLRWIKSEFAKRPAGIDVDLFFGGGIDPHVQLKDSGLLEVYRVPDSILSTIPKELHGVPIYDPGFAWYGAAISGFGIIYNKVVLAKLSVAEPKTWEDLANPKLFSWVGSGDPRHSGTVHMMYEIILQAYGWDRGWQVLTAMSGNTRQFVPSGGDVPQKVASGELAIGTAVDFYAWTQVSLVGKDRVGFVMPEGLTVINPDGISILKGAPHLAAAKAFVDFVLSEQGQKLWYVARGTPGGPSKYDLLRMPVRADIYEKYASVSPVTMNPFKTGKALEYNSALGSARWNALNDLIGATLIDGHKDLVATWKALIRAGKAEAVLPELSKPPVTEAELADLGKTKFSDDVFRNGKISEWVSFARDKYRKLAP